MGTLSTRLPSRVSKANCLNPSYAGLLSLHLVFALALLLLTGIFAAAANSQPVVQLTGEENGNSIYQHQSVWHDGTAQATLNDAVAQLKRGEFSPLSTPTSTGLLEGTLWSYVVLHNPSQQEMLVYIEYVDHQLIGLTAFGQEMHGNTGFSLIAEVSLNRPFAERPVPHHRFVLPTVIGPGERVEHLLKYSSQGKGYVFPAVRIWAPEQLSAAQTLETSGFAFIAGGFFLMAIFALVSGIITRIRFFFVYSVYALSKLLAWATIIGFTHQFVITENFHWSYISIAAAVSIFSGLLFTRMFLRTSQFTPWLDKVLLVMMGNALLLILFALFKIKVLAVLCITLALLLYPVAVITGIKRALQGSKEAWVYTLAWGFLMAGLMTQALRDLGFIEHSIVNYFWPVVASYTEMMVVMVAMGMRVSTLRQQKIAAQRYYHQQLEQSKQQLEQQVRERTRDLEAQKRQAELEAQTDSLTGSKNRRSFFVESQKILKQYRHADLQCSLLMFDIDNFKSINDNYGHAAGDQALRAFSQVVRSHIRDTDIFARLGGEEFSLLCMGSKEDALHLAERLREAVSNIDVITPKGKVRFTTSIGVAHLGSETMIDELMHQADSALYQAKMAGRDQVVESR